MNKNTARFDGKSEIYAKARPKYSEELIDFIKESFTNNCVFADIGSGTGIFTEQLLNCGYEVFAVEPNTDMRQKAEEKLCGICGYHSINSTAENTTLEDNSIDCITVAQAFHWFDAEHFKKECKRILKPDGKILIIYNSRVEDAECTKALTELRKKYCPEFRGFSGGIKDDDCVRFFDGNCRILRYDNSQKYDKESYKNRLLSSSYSLKEDDAMYRNYIDEIYALYDKFSVNGEITVPTDTVVYIG